MSAQTNWRVGICGSHRPRICEDTEPLKCPRQKMAVGVLLMIVDAFELTHEPQ